MIENIRTKHVTDLPGFLVAISEFCVDKNLMWYRGQPYDIEDYKLLPSIQRKYGKDSMECEKNFFEQFTAKSEPFLTKKPNNDWEWLYLMQHYGIPTRLLDWSENALIALSFSLYFKDFNKIDGGKTDIDAVVWCLDPFELNSSFLFLSEHFIPNATNHEISRNFGKESTMNIRNSPIAAIGSLNNDRIISQKGVFTIFPKQQEPTPLEYTANADKFLSKIIIKHQHCKKILKDLGNLGFTSESLYPSLESVAKSIVREFEERKTEERTGEQVNV